MPTYRYRCAGCGEFEVRRPMTEVAAREHCPGCQSGAPRVFTAPASWQTSSGWLSPALRRAVGAQQRSRDEPEVVTSVPTSARRTPVTRDPRHLKLPRP